MKLFGGVRKVYTWLSARVRSQIMFAAIPFALLANTSATVFMLTIEPDGSAHRQISVVAAPYFRDQVPVWVKDVRTGTDWDMAWTVKREDDFIFNRDARVSALPATGEEAALTITDVFQNPLSFYTTYQWRELVSYSYLYDSDPSSALATEKKLRYVVTMPGNVTEATVNPAKGSNTQTEGREVIFELDTSQGQQTIEVSASRLRWGYLLLIAYVLAYIAYCLMRVVQHQLRIRPRKI